ncbi:MAG: cytochrome c maturation protein CcmE [Bryobacterales bacterium]|nr:cytochrome c maturation protein CcmE [Bryobacterales bacterium]
MKPYVKFGLLTTVIIGTLAWLAVGGISDTKSYYKEVSELKKMGDEVYTKRLRVAGDVAEGSVQRNGHEVRFLLKQNDLTVPVLYDAMDPLPDTFKGGAQAVAHGRMGRDGVFHASKIDAKCASKYEAKPGKNYQPPGQTAPPASGAKASL